MAINTSSQLLATALANPEKTLELTLAQWDLLIRQARRAGVLARLGHILDGQQLLTKVPAPALKHIQSAQVQANNLTRSLDWELQSLQRALDSIDLPLILLKGAAYCVAENKAALGRVFSDLDILVPEKYLQQVERVLNIEGWKAGYVSKYDQQYYRKWMHELPPMQHVQRHTSVDVHHNILPKTNKHYPDAKKLLDNTIKILDKNLWVLSPEHRVIHSATHLFNEGELEHGFRDLSDLDLLLKEFSLQEGFWDRLIKSGIELNQQRALCYALRYTKNIFNTPIPSKILASSEFLSLGGMEGKLLDFLYLRALMPDHNSCDDRWTGLARWLLYIRSHWLRMPMHLLIPHLLRKSWMRLTGKAAH